MKLRNWTHIRRAKHIAVTLGTYRAARYLFRRGYSIDAALWIICNK